MSDSKSQHGSRRTAGVGREEETQLYFSADAVVRILDDYLAALKIGQAPSREELLAQHPQLAGQLEACLAGLDFIHQAQATTHPQQKIGDFRLVREVGRGGMGAVYEAIQTSLGRRVALKILRFSTASDKDALERFQREAETVATLHHTNIVPIFFVGSENGVNYYAMQFIEGRDLAQVIADRDTEVPPLQVAAWGLQAAEALAHAHRRGVVHRDVKPSNLILDKEERLWLTDFGLARRTDDVTLSLTGMLLGTPRYMSPEHARASTKRIDHRSDIFSLGATLYELLTRTPAFPGDAAHDVIQHILTDDPTPIRQLNPTVPRDLETVVMKCLAKEPSARYATADDLAADLRAVLDDRAIRARRASQLELARRWLKQNQRSVSQTSTAAIATLAVTLTAFLAWTSYTSWRMSGIRLGASNPPLVAEILNAQGELVRTETLPMQDTANFPAGQYAVRVSAEGTLSQTFDLSLDRGRKDARYTVNVADQWLVSPQPIEHSFDVFDTGREQAVALWGKEGITVHQLHGPPSAWSLALSPQTASALENFPGYSNPRPASDVQQHAFGEANESRPWIIHEQMDVNSDGVGDIVCAARHQAWMMTISGTGNGVLWFAGRGRELSTTRAEGTQMRAKESTQSSVLYPPVVCADIDGDAVRDFVVAVATLDSDIREQQNTYACDRWLEAISSRTGESLWRYDLPDELFTLPASEEVPYDLRWFHPLFRGRMSQGGNTMWLGQHHLRSPPRWEETGSHAYLPLAPQLLELDGQTHVALAAGRSLLLLDAKSGQPREKPLELPFRPGRVIQWADADGDGFSDIITLEEVPGLPNTSPDPKLVVWSVAKRKQLWSRQLDAYWPSKRGGSIPAPQWPLVTDLNGDGKCEIIVPDGRSHNSTSFTGGNASRQLPSGNIVVYDGASGAQRWTRRIVTLDAEVDYVSDGPDIDGDGSREVFAATCEPKGANLYVDALSGSTGKTLWTASKAVPGETTFDSFRIAGLKWWGSGVDGWPQLAVSLTDNRYYSQSVLDMSVLTFSSGTGKLMSVGSHIAEIFPADLDRDGAEELIVCSSEGKTPNSRGSLHCVRGMGRQVWKRLASLGLPLIDVDRDGVRDFVRSWGDGTLVATSGASGDELWRSRDVRAVSEMGIYAAGELADSPTRAHGQASSGDLNADGFEDFVVAEAQISGRRRTPLHAISGRTGKLLWSMEDVKVQMMNGTLATKIVDLDRDGQPEVLWLAAVDHNYPQPKRTFSTMDVQLWLFAASGRSGRLRWAQPLSPAYGFSVGNVSPHVQFSVAALDLATADLNGDGVMDVVVPAVKEDGSLETRVLEGKEGRVLWSRSRSNDGLGQQSLENWTSPTLCDWEGDGKPELALVEPYIADATSSVSKVEVAVTVLDAAGRQVWMHPTGSAFTHFSSSLYRKGDVLRPIAIGGPDQLDVALSDSDSQSASAKGPRGAQRTTRVVVLLPADSKIVSFDATGAALERKLRQSAEPGKLFAHDIDRDGQDEVFFIDGGTAYAVRADNLDEVLWQRVLGDLGQQQILRILPESDAFPPLVVARTDATSNTVIGLDARNGHPVWNCPGPIARGFDSGSYLIQTGADVLGGTPTQPPLVRFHYEFINDCRQAILTASDASAGGPGAATDAWARWAAHGTSRAPAATAGVAEDRRWQRPLPWFAEFRSEPRVLFFFLWAIFFATTLVVIPACYSLWLVAKRRFQLTHLLLLPVVAAIFVQAVLITAPEDNEFNNFPARFSIALLFAPPVIALLLLGRWIAYKRWRRIGMWTMVVFVTGVAIGAISITMAMRTAPLIEHESFHWRGWYLIFLPGAYLTSFGIMLSVPLEALGRWWFKRRASRLGEPHRPALSSPAAQTSSGSSAGPPAAEKALTGRV